MSLTAFLTQFARMKREMAPDGLGGTRMTWEPEEMFLGNVTAQHGQEVSPGGLTAARTRTVLVHLPGVLLRPGDVVRRLFDGAEWRVTGASDDMCMPRFQGTGCAQVPVERLVTAP